MSEASEPENDGHASSEQAEVNLASETPESSTSKSPSFLRRFLIGFLITIILIAISQAIAPSTDHQYANMFGVLSAMVGGIYCWFLIYMSVKKRGFGFIVPLLSVLVVGGLAASFRFDGFSGEMLPKFVSRFNEKREIRAVVETSSDDESSVESRKALTGSLGFLGTRRTGVIEKREFAIPKRSSDVVTLWNQGIGEGWSSFAVSEDRAVTMEQREKEECVTCYRLSDGVLLWIANRKARHQNALGGIGPRSTPTIVGDRVYALSATGKLWCLDLQSGDEIWSQDLLALAGWDQLASEVLVTWGRAASPLIVDGLCVVPYGGPELNESTGRSLIAFDAWSGEIRWTAGEDQISYASPALMTLGGVRQIVSVNEKTITGHEIETGKVLWDFVWPGESNGGANCAMAMPAGENRFLVGKGYGGGSALVEVKATSDGELQAEEVVASSRILKTKFTHACVDGEVAYAISNGSLEAVVFADEKRLWTQPRRSRFGQGQMLLVEDVIIGQSESGEVALVKAQTSTYEELLRLEAMDSVTWNVPTIAGRHLLVRNDRQAICFLLPERSDP